MTDLIARLTELEKAATPGPWTSRDEKRGAKKSIWRADTAREVSEAEWGRGSLTGRLGMVPIARAWRTASARKMLPSSSNFATTSPPSSMP